MTSPVSGRPLPSSFDENEEFYNESGFQKVMGRMKREPLVPIGCLLTVAAFTSAYRAMRRGDHHQVQRMFRARVAAQGFTVVVMVVSGLYLGAERNREREGWKADQQDKDDEKRARWIRELEARDDEEKNIKAMLDRKRERRNNPAAAPAASDAARDAARDSFRAAEAKRLEADAAARGETAASEGNKAGSGWGLGGWLGGGKSSPDQADPSQPKTGPEEPRK